MSSYLSIIFGTTFIAWLNNIIETKKDFFLKISLLFLAIIAGLRWEVGNDYLSYYSIFNNINFMGQSHIEIGYEILNKIFYNLGFHFNFMLFFIACFEMFLLFKFFQYFSLDNKNYYIYIFIYLITREHFMFLSLIRQGIATYFFIFSLKYLFEKNLKNFIFICLLGSLFHKSILLFLFYELLCYKLKNKKIVNLLAFITVLVFIILGEKLSFFLIKFLTLFHLTNYIGYVEYTQVHFNTGLGFLSKFSFVIILFFFYGKEENKFNFILTHIQFYYILNLLQAVGFSQFYRISPYYLTFVCFLPEIITFKVKKKFLIIFSTLILGTLIFIKLYLSIDKTMPIQYKRFNDKYRLIFNKNDIYRGKIFYYNQDTAKVTFR